MQKTMTKIAETISNDTGAAVLPVMKVMFGPTGNKGRGVICAYPIKKGEIVEYAPVIPMPKSDVLEGSVPESYVLCWKDNTPEECYCMVGGFVMLYNHSNEPNVKIEDDVPNQAIRVTATRDIEKGEEIVWNYNCELWFNPQE